ncbi:hypothetical protein [Brevundimonas sp. NPDC058933]|uniref:hypothetical protein n=1 Tax=Brevundimonas sp. NPDC058933 TaxID=3346673 RepID=UPI003BEF1634
MIALTTPIVDATMLAIWKAAISECGGAASHDPHRVIGMFDDPLKAAIFLATISADPERATLFKLFWQEGA